MDQTAPREPLDHEALHDIVTGELRPYLLDAMREIGGSFVQSLGECLTHADPMNTRRLIDAFPDYLTTYAAYATRRRDAAHSARRA